MEALEVTCAVMQAESPLDAESKLALHLLIVGLGSKLAEGAPIWP